MSNGLGRAGIARHRAVLCHRSSRRYGPSCLAGRTSTVFVSSLRLKAHPMGQFFVVPARQTHCFSVPYRPTTRQDENNSFSSVFSPSAETLYHFHQLFIIFTSITMNNTYIQIQAATRPIVGMSRSRTVPHGRMQWVFLYPTFLYTKYIYFLYTKYI